MASANTSSWSCQWRQYRRQAERVSFHSKCPNVGQRRSCAARLCLELDWAWTRIRIGDDGNEWSIGIAGTFQLRRPCCSRTHPGFWRKGLAAEIFAARWPPPALPLLALLCTVLISG